jgi:hypothetical protein
MDDEMDAECTSHNCMRRCGAGVRVIAWLEEVERRTR